MHAFEKETSQIVDILDHAHKQIEAIENPAIQWLKTKIIMDLKRHANALKMQLGIDISGDQVKAKATPLKKIFGKEITGKPIQPADLNKPFHDTSFDVELKELQLKVEELYPRFLITESDHLLDSLSDIEIRGVAKKAGLPVTDNSPKKVDVAFIEQIKKAMQTQLAAHEPTEDDNLNQDLSSNPDSNSGLNDDPAAAATNPNTNDAPDAPDLRTDEEKELDALRKDVDKLYSVFVTLENKSILDTYSDIEIRGVAKKAGLPVTDNSPKKVDNKFLDHIKTAIKKQAEIEKAGNI